MRDEDEFYDRVYDNPYKSTLFMGDLIAQADGD